ncbi:MAG: deoxyribose-phosphate aldolase [Bacteroidetes bacterium]|nr:deoxyribose-phosphate aldolase [Bacteroidota bacterium]|tara:strand:- start:323 stop:1150 length:828 start_codon:yes stop_codon:yes gene_type:complete
MHTYTETEVNTRIENIINEQISTVDEKKAYADILSLVDLTTLEGSDNEEKIKSLCEQAMSFKEQGEGVPNVAAVCVYPPFVKQAKELLKGTGISVASVAGAFPSGQSPIEIKVAEIKYAVAEGADDIDMVISRGKFLSGDHKTVGDEVRAIKDACGNAHLKVILETGELQTLDNIRLASDISIANGGDFIKTSTGKIQPAATEQAFLVMLDAIKDEFDKSGKKIGIKPAGGIAEPEDALRYYLLVKGVLGDDWLNSHLFRFGASRLATKLLNKII